MRTSYTRHILIASFLLSLLVILTLSLTWYSNTSRIKRRLEDIRDRFEISNFIHTMSDASRLRALSAHRMLLMDDILDRYDEQDNFYKYANMFLIAKSEMLSHPAFNSQDRLAWDKIKSKVTAGGELHAQIVSYLIEKRDQKAIHLLKSKSKSIQDEFIGEFNNILSKNNQEVNTIVTQAKTINDGYLLLVIIIGGSSVVLFTIVFVYAYRYISKTELSLPKAHDLEKTENEYKSDFLARTSHELRTPLNAILGFTQVINMDKNSGLPKEYITYFKHIEQSGWQLLSLIDDIMEMTRISEQAITLDIENVSLRTVISACVNAHADVAKEHEVNCSYSFANTQIDIIETDLNRVSQILENLITNAIKYNHRGGTVSIHVSESDRQMIRFEVKNSGAGISNDDMNKLFKPFARVGNLDKADGPGIGLVLTKGLVECLHGHIGVESQPGLMTVFWVELPKSYSDTSRHGND